MSRVGQMPINVPNTVKITIDGRDIAVEGPKGQLTQIIHQSMQVNFDNGVITVERPSDQKMHKSLHGLTRSLIANMVTGVTEGYEKRLRVVGTGYRAELDPQNRLILNVGYSHPVTFAPAEGITLSVGTSIIVDAQPHIPITINGIDKQVVGQTAASIRQIKKPEVYQPCKGIRYEGEQVRNKEGKTRV